MKTVTVLRGGAATLALALLGTVTGCSASSSTKPATVSGPSATATAASASPTATLPNLVSLATMLVDVQQSGAYQATTQPVTAGDLTLQVACIGGGSTITVNVTSAGPGNQLLWSAKQGCAGGSQKAVFNPGAQPKGMQVKVTATATERYEVLMGK